jgi:hypothetical protein
LSSITDQDYLVRREPLDMVEHPVSSGCETRPGQYQDYWDLPLKNDKFARVGTVDRPISPFTLIVIRQDILTTRQIVWQLKQIWVIDQFPQKANRFERLRIFST